MRKRTKNKEIILQVVRSTDSHPTAEWIYDEVRKEIPHISLGTVYRNLGQLRDSGVITELFINSSPGRFESKTSEHYHLICEQCGQVVDVDEKLSKEFIGSITRETGFRVLHYGVEFYGLCRECQQSQGGK